MDVFVPATGRMGTTEQSMRSRRSTGVTVKLSVCGLFFVLIEDLTNRAPFGQCSSLDFG